MVLPHSSIFSDQQLCVCKSRDLSTPPRFLYLLFLNAASKIPALLFFVFAFVFASAIAIATAAFFFFSFFVCVFAFEHPRFLALQRCPVIRGTRVASTKTICCNFRKRITPHY